MPAPNSDAATSPVSLPGAARRSVDIGDVGAQASLRRIARVLAIVALVIGISTLGGWVAEVRAPLIFGAGQWSMKCNTALAVFLLAAAVLLSMRPAAAQQRRARACAWLAVLLTGSTLAQDMFGVDFRIDRFFVRDPGGATGRMSVLSSAELLGFGIAVVAADVRAGDHGVARWLTLAGTIAAWFAFAGHLYDAESLYAVEGFTAQSLPATLACLAIGLASLCSRPHGGFMGTVSSATPAGQSLRQLIPALMVVPLVLGWLRLSGQRLGWYGTEFGVALLSVASALSLLAISVWNARSLGRVQAGRDLLLARLENQRTALAAEDRFRGLVRDAPAGMFETDARGRCVYTNATWGALSGLSDDEAAGDGWLAAIHPEDRGRVAEEWEDAAREHRPFVLAYRYRRPSGETVWVECTTVAMRDAAQRLTGFLGVVLDVSRQHAATTALQRSEANFRAVVERAPLGFVVVRDRKLRYLNPAAVRMFGYAHEEELVGHDYAELVAPGEHDVVERRLLAAGTGKMMPSRTTRVLRRDGSEAFVEGSPTPITFDGEPSLGFVIADVTAQVATRELEAAAAEAVRRSEANFRTLVEAAPLGFLVHDHGIIRFANPTLERILGLPRELLLGRPVDAAFTAPGRAVAAASEPTTDTAGMPSRLEFAGAGGTPVVTECTSVEITFDGQPVEASFLDDVTERERMERGRASAEAQLRASLAEKETLLKEVHHRVKNNLQVIASLIGLQASGLENSAAKLAFAEMRGRVRAIASIHERMYRTPDVSRMNMREYLDDLPRDIGRALAQPGRSIAVEVACDEIYLSLDAAIPVALLINEAMTNAYKHAFSVEGHDRGSVWISLRRRHDELELEIRDDGVGMPTESLTDTRSLGTSLIHGLAVQLGGLAHFTVAEGTRCTVRFPDTRAESKDTP